MLYNPLKHVETQKGVLKHPSQRNSRPELIVIVDFNAPRFQCL